MHLRLMATYLGVPYQAGLGPDGNQVTLFSPGPPPEELGFAAGPGHWRKEVGVTDLEALWHSRPAGDYRGEPCLVLDDLGDRLHIAYLGRDAARAAQLGYWEIDREVFEVVVARHDVTDLVEERVDVPLAAAMFPVSGSQTQTGGQAAGAVTEPVGYGEAAGPAAYGEAAGPAAYGEAASPAAYGEAAGPAVYGEAAGPAVYDEAAGPAGYTGAAANGGGTPAGYRGADHQSRMPDRVVAWHGSPAPEPWPELPARDEDQSGTGSGPGLEPRAEPGAARRTGRRDRISPESVFAELLNLAAIPQGAYAVDEEVPGAMCLVEADGGFEVFSRTDNARLEVQFFEDEEAAYFYLFGVLAAEAIRSGRLTPSGPGRANGHHNGTSASGTPTVAENVSKYLRGRKLPR